MKKANKCIYDRLYGQMEFPSIIYDLLDCPGLLRLRDVRMANNQFYAFPAFANSSRYEHSLGVCYLAGICAKELNLSEKDKIELMIAGLYHDIGTPPFAHAMEEVLQAKCDFNHEENLEILITGEKKKNKNIVEYNYEQDYAQVYLGQSLKLKRFCQSPKAIDLGIDRYRIANIVVGNKNDELAPLINGSGMDLDNIDNICRAVSAMGIIGDRVDYGRLARELASSFILKNGKIYYNKKHAHEISRWLNMRDIQYTEIYKSIDDFSYQTMIKRAIHSFGEGFGKKKLDKNLWKLTDSEFTYKYLLDDENSKTLMERVMLCRPYPLLSLFYVRGSGCTKRINENIENIERETRQYIYSKTGFTKYIDEKEKDIVLANFYPDKRYRWIPEEKWLGEGETEHGFNREEGAILGLFTQSLVSGYATDKANNTRTVKTFDKRHSAGLALLIHEILKDYEVVEYGAENLGRDSASYREDQLGF